MEYEPVIGMEVHVQLLTATKMFCRCAADYASAAPNTRVCPVCLGLPGVLPVINRKAVESAILTALALNCQVAGYTRWDRKNYPYPDLPKGYQISQYEHPLAFHGWLEVGVGGVSRRIRIRRAHLEEDTAKLVHVAGRSLIDFNRAGVPLLEIVSEPDIRSPEEARLYLIKLRTILRYLGVSSANMEEGAMRCEANISLRPAGTDGLPATHVEVKNLNSFRAVKQALEYEIRRQQAILKAGGQVEQVTVGWDEERGQTVLQRSKEEAHDYRYFPEPDLPPLRIPQEWVDELRRKLPELPDACALRLQREYRLGPQEAALLAAEQPLVQLFEQACSLLPAVDSPEMARKVANWIVGPLFHLMNRDDVPAEKLLVRPAHLAELIQLVETGSISTTSAREVLEQVFRTGESPGEIVRRSGLVQVSDVDALRQVVQEVLAANPKALADYRAGKKQARQFLIGQVMRATRGQANPQALEKLLQEILEGHA